MKLGDLIAIPDDATRFIKAHQFLQRLAALEEQVIAIRSQALLNLREEFSQQTIADWIGVSAQRIGALEKKARNARD